MGLEWIESFENLSRHHTMEINNHFNHLQRKGMTSSSFGSAPALHRERVEISPTLHEQHVQFQHQLLQLKQQQQIQQQLLLQHFQLQQQQLAQQHEKQLQERIKFFNLQEYLEQQRKLDDEQNERRDQERLQQLKKKEKHEQSAVASTEVKQRLQEFVLSKKQREAAVNSTNNSPSNFRNWSALLGKYEDDFPLRKTVDGNKSDSPGSPPNGANLQSLSSVNGRTVIQEESPTSHYNPTGQVSVNDFTLYSSPSLPNISLGRPPVPSSTSEGKSVSAGSEAQAREMAAVRLGMPLTSQVLHSLAFYPALPVIDGKFTPPTSPGYIQQPGKVIDGSTGSLSSAMLSGVPGLYSTTPITDAQVAQARLHRTIHRPLGRTQSAPLPLGHPMLQPQSIMLSAQQSEQYAREKRLCEQQQQHNLLKQHIRQTVLTRAGSKNQVENVEEETEAAMAQEMKDSGQPEIIDLTDRINDTEASKQQKERELYIQHQRDLMARNTLQISDGSAFMTRPHMARPLSRALSSPLVALSPIGSPPETQAPTRHTFTTGFPMEWSSENPEIENNAVRRQIMESIYIKTSPMYVSRESIQLESKNEKKG